MNPEDFTVNYAFVGRIIIQEETSKKKKYFSSPWISHLVHDI